jgi:3-hydroxybutyryl-CoA dehydrogenase
MVKKCKKCGRQWYYQVDECIFCRFKLVDVKPSKFKVMGYTEVFIPSTQHKEVPYYDLLLEDDKGNFFIKKTFERHKIGDILKTNTKVKSVEGVVGVIGTNIGAEIAQLAAQTGYNVVLKSRSKKSLKKALDRISKNLLRNLNVEDKEEVKSKIRGVTDYKPLKDCDIIIESIIEDLEEKKKLFAKIDEICTNKTILATNTSSLSVSDLASVTKRVDRVVGFHFFNPPSKMRLVEIVRGQKTSAKTVDFAEGVARQMNKVVVVVNDTPCFIVNRVLMPYLNEAVLMLEENTAMPHEIDYAAKMGLNHPMGPLTLLDLIGLDVFVEIMNNLYDRTGNQKYKPAELAVKMVKEGKLGRKTKEGFYKY